MTFTWSKINSKEMLSHPTSNIAEKMSIKPPFFALFHHPFFAQAEATSGKVEWGKEMPHSTDTGRELNWH